jgi:hypothetical protein
VTTESLLRAVVGDDAPELFAWIREQPFVEHCAEGVFLHDVVQEAPQKRSPPRIRVTGA